MRNPNPVLPRALPAAEDPHVPTDGRYKVLQALNDANVTFTWHELNGAHAFMRDEGSAGRYDGELALQCYMMCVNLFRRKLNDGCAPPRACFAPRPPPPPAGARRPQWRLAQCDGRLKF